MIDTLLKAFGRTRAGTTPAEFEAQVRDRLAVVKQPKLGVSSADLGLQADAGTVRPVEGQRVPGVRSARAVTGTKENVIGSAAEYSYADGKIVRDEQILGRLDPGPGKTRTHLRADRSAAGVRRRQRQRRHAGIRPFRAVDQP